MTNSEKYLKDGVNIQELWENFDDYYYKNKEKESDVAKAFKLFFWEQAKPTLTEDERVILRNLEKSSKFIGRTKDGCLFYVCVFADDRISKELPFSHLFQFIKKRRRIRNSRTFERRIIVVIIVACDICRKEIGRYDNVFDVREGKLATTYTDPLNRTAIALFLCEHCKGTAFKEFDERLKASAERLKKAAEEYDHRLEVVLPKKQTSCAGADF